MFYSPSTGGFYLPGIHRENTPADAVEITDDQHQALLEGESQGKVIATDVNGFPVLQDPPPPAQPTQLEKDQQRYQLRAAAKDGLIAWMAADNMSRVRAGVWTVADLQVLLVDLAPVNAMMQTLSFELAAQAIAASTNPLLTPEIKAAWVAKLTEHFYT